MLYLLDKGVRTVKWNGVPLHEASSAIVKEEVNGDFVLTVRYPITDSGIYQFIKEDMLIKAPVPVLSAQLFRIKKPVENDDSLDITAYHITDDIMQRSINPMNVVRQGCFTVLSQMVQNAKTNLGNFSFTSDIADNHTFITDEVETLYTVLIDGKHSIVGTWEGELVRDNFALSVKRSRGTDRGVVITTHKNLKAYQRTKDSQGVVTRIHARSTFRAEGAEEDTTISVTVDSPLIGNYPYINEKEYQNNDIHSVEELRKWAERKFKYENIDKPTDEIKIEAYELDGQVIHLGDIVNIKSRKHDVDLHKKAIAYEYNALTEEYISITFDDKPGVGGSGVSSGVSNAADVILNANRNAQEVAVERAIRNANQAFDAEFDKRVEVINDGIEQAKAEAELYADNIKQSIDAEIAQVNQSMQAQSEEHDRQVANILSKTQSVESLANQAKSDVANALTNATQLKADAVSEAQRLVNTLKTETVASSNRLKQQIDTIGNQLSSQQAELLQATQTVRGLDTQVKSVANQLGTQQTTITQLVNDGNARGQKIADFETYKQTIDQNLAQLGSDIRMANGSVTSLRTEYNQTKSEIALLASKSDFDALTQKTQSLEASLKVQAGKIDLKAERTLIDTINQQISSAQAELTVVNDAIAQRVTKTDFNAVKRTAEANATAIMQVNNAIELKAEKTYVEGVKSTADSALAKANANANTITQTKAELKVASDAIETKATKVDLNNLTGRMSTAETTIRTQAGLIEQRLTSTQVESAINSKGYQTASQVNTAITGKGYQTKSDVDSNITGRGYITSSALQPYALSTTVQNLVKETADSFSRTISETKALIPTEIGSRNLILDFSNRTISTYNNPSNVARESDVSVAEWDTNNARRLSLTTTSTGTFGYISSGRTAEMGQRYYLPNTAYTGSIYIKNLTATAFKVSINTSKTVSIGPNQTTRVILTDLTSGQRFLQLNFLSDTANVNIDFIYWHPQIEQGTVATASGPAPEDLATVTALHAVNDTVDSHSRTIGAVGTAGSILDNVSKVTQTAAGLVTEVSGTNGLKTQVRTLAGSYAIKNLTSSGTVLNQLNLNKDGSVKIDGKLVQITGTTYIQDGVITSAKIAGLDAGKITSGTVDAARIKANSIDGSKMVFDQAFVNKMTANEALFKQLFAKNAFITSVQAVALSASQISSGIIKATNEAMLIDLDNALTEYKERATIRFHSAGNVLYREKKHPRGHNTIGALMFKDSNGGGVMTAVGNTSHQTIDTMRNNYGEGGLTGSFAGIRVVRDDADANRDRVDIIADRIIMAHSTNFQEPTNSGFYFYPTAVRGWWNLGAILQHISNKFKEHGWGEIGDIYHLGYAAETTPSQYT
ncbi:TPA: hypothetical protein U1729_001296 [Streptococcus suis]|nr:hypothetical protein [Streptococcus suis]HEM5651194.1 hypothetical protein [Streptococcus suis]